jgi:hypothetical protein
MRRIRRHLTFANVASGIALFVVLTGGTAVALDGANTVFTDDIANDTQPASGGNPAGGLVAADLRPNSVGSSEVTNGSVASSDLAPAARGARAYGRVDPDGILSRSKNVTAVTNPSTGVHCIDPAPSINPATAVLVAGSDFSLDSTSISGEDASVVEWSASTGSCPAGTLAVLTFAYLGDSIDDDDGGGNSTGDNLVASDESFAFVIP